ncbi:MAG: MATE family efflux transporter [Thermoanaerobaculia bacterium]|nr:MAG: MATE family efflux transporter [Thermoanaerobaculia bacterium]MBZ0103365.1 MATE family efflux transporter [Thermoanaerobaculia bacterium]
MRGIRHEVRRLTALATPIALTQLSSMLLWTVDLLMVGQVSVEALNAVSLGRVWVMGTTVVALGFVFGLDPIAAQAAGARDRDRLGSALLNGAGLALLVTLPVAGLWLFTGDLLARFGQDPATVALADAYVKVQIPALPFFLLFMTLRQFLQARGIVRPTLWISLGANVFNAAINLPLIFGGLGIPALGATGAGIGTAITQVTMLVALLVVARQWRLGRGVRLDAGRRDLRLRRIGEIARLGAPVAFQISLEYWAFAITTLWAGRLGTRELAAHSIVLNLASLAYMVPLGISIGATTRVGNRIGAGDRPGARRAAWVAFGLAAMVMLVFAAGFVLGRGVIPGWYSRDAAVVALAASVLPIVAAFELFDGLQVVGGGILRGVGQTRVAAAANLFGYYALGLPLGAWLGAPERWGLAGLWWGLALGLCAVALTLVVRVAWRGPHLAAALVERGRP